MKRFLTLLALIISTYLSAQIPTDGLVAYYPFNGNADDENVNSPGAYNGTLFGPTLSSDRFDNANVAYSFDGVDDYIEIGDVIIDELSELTISVWVYPTARGSDPSPNGHNLKEDPIIHKAGGSNDNLGLTISEGGIAFYIDNGPDNTIIASNSELNTWSHYVFVYGAGYQKIYVDNVEAASGVTNIANIATTNNALRIGGRKSTVGADFYFEGSIDDIRIYDRELNTSEIQTLFEENMGGGVLGCTDPSAHNYNPLATSDDGSCQTCSDGAQNGDETGMDCGGSCTPCDTSGGGGGNTSSLWTLHANETDIFYDSGLVGIGTSNPTDRLDIVGGNVTINNPANPTLRFHNGTSSEFASIFRQSSSGDLYIRNDYGSNIILDNGNVGIGTTAPSDKLDIVGGNVTINNPANPTLRFHNGTSSEFASIYRQSSGDLYIRNDHGSNIILDNGNVGIGTNTPLSKLAVNGKILAQEVQVQGDINVPDYVFSESYPLMSLKDLEQYIMAECHLPDIPSAEDIKKAGGFELGDMDMRLLKKIEELTLYTILQQNDIKKLIQQMTEQENTIEVLRQEIKLLNQD